MYIYYSFCIFSKLRPPKYAPIISNNIWLIAPSSYFKKKPAVYTIAKNTRVNGLTFLLSHESDNASASHLRVTDSISCNSISSILRAVSLSGWGKVSSLIIKFFKTPRTPLSGIVSARL
jgi:hypothetical protein